MSRSFPTKEDKEQQQIKEDYTACQDMNLEASEQ